ncbi:MAG: transporter substrate-binding domain-containing protein [Deltaproteobacteria bacterium]|nr:transporter substrate-binding domain-containing protein [Deltaproteobacteria bacterium]MBW2072359.1 transporter substrate-binding domain-containing protein [Deltaproteobacteria bacterium]
MKRMLTLLIVVAVSLSMSFSVAQAKTLADIIKSGKIVIGVKGDYPPWGVINAKGQFEGWEIDLCHKLAEYLFGDPSKVEFVAVTGGNRIPFLNSGKIDIIWATMGYTPQRAKVVDYSIPYFKSGVQLLTKKGSGIKSIYDLKGKTVITIKGTTGAQGLAKLVPEAKQIKFDKTSEALQALRDDRGVAFAQDDILLFKLILDNPELEVVGEVFNPTDWGIGFRKGEDDIKAYVNLALRYMYQTGYLQSSLRKWWKGQELDEYLKRIDDMFSK